MAVFLAKTENEGQRADVFLASKVKELSRSSLSKLFDEDKVKINQTIIKPSHKIHTGDKVSLGFDLGSINKTPRIRMPVIYEDEDVVVLDKPAGVLTHSKGVFNPEATVAAFIKPRLIDLSGERAGIVHRLDRGTSGVIICAKTARASKFLQKQFSTRKVKKTYIALVAGELDPPEAIIDMPIERNPKKPQTFRTGPNGKSAVTTYKTLKSRSGYGLIELTPKTGRTHQLRVHLKQLNHPIVGDDFYDGEPAERLYLHAQSLNIMLPNGKKMLIKSPLPEEFNKMLK